MGMGLKATDLERLLSEGADLKSVDLRGARFKGVDLSGRDLAGVNLGGANLSGADLSGANLAGADLSGARLQDARLTGADLSDADLHRARLKGADLSGANLTGARMVRLSLAEVNLKGARLIRADLTEADLARCQLEEVDLSEARLARATLDSSELIRVILAGADGEETYLERATLREVDLSRARLHRANLVQARLIRPTVSGAVFTEADLAEATIEGCDFEGCDLTGAILDQAHLKEVSLAGATVDGTDLQGVRGLSPEELEALRARGAVIHALALSRLLDALLASRAFRVALSLALVFGVGFFFYYYTRPTQQPRDAVLDEAQALRQANQHKEALDLYDALLAKAGDDTEQRMRIQYLRAETLIELDRNEEASAIYRQLAENNQGNKDEEVNARLRLAAVQIDQGSYDEAIPALEAIADDADTAPADVARALISLSSVYDRMGFADKAIQVAERALNRYPDRPVIGLAVNRHIARLLVDRQEFDRAQALLDELEDVVHDDSERAELLMSRAQLYEEMGDQERSLEVMSRLLRDFPDNPEVSPEVRYELAGLLADRGEVEQAQRILQDLMEARSNGSLGRQAAVSLARLLAGVGRNLKALEILEGLEADANLGPEDRGLARLARAEILSRMGKRTEALTILQNLAASQEEGQVAAALLMQAQVQLDLEDLAAAERTFTQIQARFPAVPEMVAAAQMGLAGILEKQGRWAEAETQYQGLLSSATSVDERTHAWERLGNAQLARGDVEAARRTWEEMKAGLPEGEGQARARFGLAQIAESQGQLDAAGALYREVADATRDPNIRAIALQNLAQLYLEHGRPGDAKLTYQEIVDRVPPGHDAAFTARMGLGHLYAQQRELEPAFKLYQAAVDGTALAAQQAEGILAIGRLQLDTGAIAEAEATFQGAIDRFSGRAETVDQARLGLAQAQRARGDLAAATALYRRVAEESEDPATVSAALAAWASLLDDQGRSEEALAVQRQILKRFGDDPDASFQAHMASAGALANSGDTRGAIEAYEALMATTSDPGLKVQVLDGMARARAAGGELEAAAATYQRLIEASADQPDFLYNALMGLASVKAQLGDKDEARALYQRVATGSRDRGLQAWALESIAQLSAEAGDLAAAQAGYEDILERFDDDPAVTAGTRLGLGQLKRASDDLPGARALFEEVRRSARDGSQRAWATLYVAQVMVEQGEDGPALETLLAIPREFPEDPEVILNARLSLASLYRARGKEDEAARVYQDVAGGASFADYRVAALEGLAGIAMDAGDPQAAKAAYQQVLDRFGTNPEAAFTAQLGLARVEMASGADGARAAATRLEGLVPTTGDPVLRAWAVQALAQAHVASGDTSGARAAYRRLLDDDGGMPDLSQEARSYLDSM